MASFFFRFAFKHNICHWHAAVGDTPERLETLLVETENRADVRTELGTKEPRRSIRQATVHTRVFFRHEEKKNANKGWEK